MIFLSYPRTGVNFLCKAIEHKTGTYIPYNHDTYTNEEVILNIVRDPKESMSSWLAMSDKNEEHIIKNNSIDKVIDVITKNKYINMYKFLLSKNTIFINYKDFKKIDELIKKLSEILNLDYNDNAISIEKINQSNQEQYGEIGYLLTSKHNPKYQEYKDQIDKTDLSECYELYNQALTRCIKI
jgi:hypothetical protein